MNICFSQHLNKSAACYEKSFFASLANRHLRCCILVKRKAWAPFSVHMHGLLGISWQTAYAPVICYNATRFKSGIYIIKLLKQFFGRYLSVIWSRTVICFTSLFQSGYACSFHLKSKPNSYLPTGQAGICRIIYSPVLISWQLCIRILTSE